ncbi:MAG: YidC/Oxa1 family insertase periplasmic-domain containing protein, partial [Candidatus Omnitrophica bacterium]|nr:YidC/Oxa1 family insertase periplasmic-domain containing protein [Candidatus Omnitrophota bacterium]
LEYPAQDTTSWPATDYQVSRQPQTIIFRSSPRAGLEVEKRYHLAPGRYTLGCQITLTNHTSQDIILNNYLVLGGIVNLAEEIKDRATALELKAGTPGGVIKKHLSPRIQSEDGKECSWVGLLSQYRVLLLRPEKSAPWILTRSGQELGFGLRYPEVIIPAGGNRQLDFSLYAGPSDHFILSQEIKEPVLGNGFFASMGRFLFAVLRGIHQVIPNWGWSIIILTLLVKVAFYPLTRASLHSMKEMQRLRPYMKDLQDKYRDNPQQMQKEIMNLYREYKINPFSGCLPMLVQFPIFIGLFVSLRNSIFLRGAPFILWITDLSQPDCLFRISGFPVNILPIIMAGTSFWQQKLMPQEPSQKGLALLMPLMFLFLFYNFSSGLLLYWVTMNLAGLLEQYLVTQKTKK